MTKDSIILKFILFEWIMSASIREKIKGPSSDGFKGFIRSIDMFGYQVGLNFDYEP